MWECLVVPRQMDVVKQSDFFKLRFSQKHKWCKSRERLKTEILGRSLKMKNFAVFSVTGPPSTSPHFQEGVFIIAKIARG